MGRMVLPVNIRLPGKAAEYFLAEQMKGRSLGAVGLELITEALQARGIEVE